MSGHSKWATIKRAKGKADAARGKVFNRLIREITIAAKMGGGDPNSNPRLRTAMDKAKAANMPNKNMETAILKGTGKLEGVVYEEFALEGYGPGGVAIILECTSDNRNRTVSEIRHCFTRAGGNLGAGNSVAWMFSAKGIIRVAKNANDEDSLMELVVEAGAEDLLTEENEYEITTPQDAFEKVKEALAKAGITPISAEQTKVAANLVKVEGENAGKVMRLIDALDDNDDTQHVYTNAEISDEDAEKFAA